MLKIVSLCLLALFSPFALADTPLNANTALINQEYNNSSEALHYDININYPQIAATPLDAASSDFNNQIKKMISLEVEPFKAALPNTNKQVVKGSGLEDSESTLNISYETHVIWPRNQPIISVLLTIRKYMLGDARPSITHRSLNYDWQNAKALNLYKIFYEGESFSKFVTHYCAEELSASTGMTPKEIGTSYLPLTTWNLGSDLISFTFDNFPVPLSSQTVVIPYLSLKEYMQSNSVLIACWDGETDDCGKSLESQSLALKKMAHRVVAKA